MKFIFLVMVLVSLGCEDKKEVPANNSASNNATGDWGEKRQEVVSNVAAFSAQTYEEFEGVSVGLEQSVSAWQGAPSDATLEDARAKFHEAMDVWQRAELLQFGPAGVMGSVAAGEDLRDQIYSWPLSNTCRIDQEIVREGYANDLSGQAVNIRGLDALEYLLFYTESSNSCPINSAINTDGTWAALGEEEVRARRAAFALAVAREIRLSAERLNAHWEVGAEFRAQFEDPQSGTHYGSLREVLNAVTDSLFYVEKELKDMKLAPPIGVMGCASSSCPELAESRYADRGIANMSQNLRAFERLYSGGEGGTGFDELLEHVGAIETRDEIRADIAAATALVEGFESEFLVTLAENPDSLLELYELVRNISTLLKTEFISLLDLDLPKRAEGDND